MTAGLGSWMVMVMRREAILKEVEKERSRQDQKWGEQNHDPFKWLAILGEEVGEANNAALEAVVFRPGDKPPVDQWLMPALQAYREELIQVAAVAVSMVECLDRDKWTKKENTMSQGTLKPDTVTIGRAEYDKLVKAEQKLDALEAAGVDNWEGYGDAMASVEEKEPAAAVPTAPVAEPQDQTEAKTDEVAS